mgnify:CR=1 FL=1
MAHGISPEQLSRLEEFGEAKVRVMLSRGMFGDTRGESLASAKEWLRLKEEEREVAASDKRDVREEETLAIAKEANRLASEANSIARSQATAAWRAARYAMYAAVIAVTAAIAGNKDAILSIIFN